MSIDKTRANHFQAQHIMLLLSIDYLILPILPVLVVSVPKGPPCLPDTPSLSTPPSGPFFARCQALRLTCGSYSSRVNILVVLAHAPPSIYSLEVVQSPERARTYVLSTPFLDVAFYLRNFHLFQVVGSVPRCATPHPRSGFPVL